MPLRFALPLLLVALAATGCSTLHVSSDWDHEFAFSSLKTYTWAKSGDLESGAGMVFLDRRIKRAVDDGMAERGYRRVDSAGDFLVLYSVKVRDRTDVYRHRHWRHGYTTVDSYKEGTLTLGVVDRKRDEIVWTGWAEGILSETGQSEEKIREAVAKILERFPPL